MGRELIEIEVLPSQVNLLVGWNPRSDIHRLVKYIKGTSSRLPSLWMNTYFVAMVVHVTLEVLKRSVESQED